MVEKDEEDIVWLLQSWSSPRLNSGGERIPAMLMKEAADEIERLRAKGRRAAEMALSKIPPETQSQKTVGVA